MSKRRVVVTGLGCISPLGNSVASTWAGILAGKSGVNRIELFDAEKFTTKFAAQVKDFNPSDYMNPKDTKKMDGFIQYGYAAAVEAIQDSGIEATEATAGRIGIAIGSGIGTGAKSGAKPPIRLRQIARNFAAPAAAVVIEKFICLKPPPLAGIAKLVLPRLELVSRLYSDTRTVAPAADAAIK